MSIKEGGRRLTNIQESVDGTTPELAKYTNKSRERLITVARSNNGNKKEQTEK